MKSFLRAWSSCLWACASVGRITHFHDYDMHHFGSSCGTTPCDTKRLSSVNYVTRAIIHGKNNSVREKKIEMQFFPTNIHRIGFPDPKSHFSQKMLIGLDSSIRDFADCGGRKMESTFSKTLKNLGKKVSPGNIY